MKPINIEAPTLGDAWFQLVYNIADPESSRTERYKIDRGSYEGQERVEFVHTTIFISRPNEEPRIPLIPEYMNVPPPTTKDYVLDYFTKYLLAETKLPNEDYTYGERIWSCDQVLKTIEMLKNTPRTNHALLRVTQPSDIDLIDPPCLLHIHYKIRDDKLWCYPYFRSWDLWGGLPVNLAGIQLLSDLIAFEAELIMGPMVASSSALHIYDHHEDIVKIRLNRS